MGYSETLRDLSLPDLNKGKLKTGDLAYADKDGFYYIEGRKNRYIKIYGIRVNLSELETILSNKGIDAIMRESGENKIDVFFKDPSRIKDGLDYISKITSISLKVFEGRVISKKSLTNNFKYKI